MFEDDRENVFSRHEQYDLYHHRVGSRGCFWKTAFGDYCTEFVDCYAMTDNDLDDSMLWIVDYCSGYCWSLGYCIGALTGRSVSSPLSKVGSNGSRRCLLGFLMLKEKLLVKEPFI